jgi:hypothetical protein
MESVWWQPQKDEFISFYDTPNALGYVRTQEFYSTYILLYYFCDRNFLCQYIVDREI